MQFELLAIAPASCDIHEKVVPVDFRLFQIQDAFEINPSPIHS